MLAALVCMVSCMPTSALASAGEVREIGTPEEDGMAELALFISRSAATTPAVQQVTESMTLGTTSSVLQQTTTTLPSTEAAVSASWLPTPLDRKAASEAMTRYAADAKTAADLSLKLLHSGESKTGARWQAEIVHAVNATGDDSQTSLNETDDVSWSWDTFQEHNQELLERRELAARRGRPETPVLYTEDPTALAEPTMHLQSQYNLSKAATDISLVSPATRQRFNRVLRMADGASLDLTVKTMHSSNKFYEPEPSVCTGPQIFLGRDLSGSGLEYAGNVLKSIAPHSDYIVHGDSPSGPLCCMVTSPGVSVQQALKAVGLELSSTVSPLVQDLPTPLKLGHPAVCTNS